MKKLFYSIVLVFLSVQVFAQDISIIPRPNKIVINKGEFAMSSAKAVRYSEGLAFEAGHLQMVLKEKTGLDIPLQAGKAGKQGISLSIDGSLTKKLGREGYILNATNSGVEISAATATGVFYGIQSLLQGVQKGPNGFVLPSMIIEDKPRFSWRAFMLDEARHFKGKEEVKLLLDEMARLRMNTFHWHLTDDQGWRIEIMKYPLLTKIGSTRKSTQVGEKKWASNKQSGEPHSGFYTQDEIKEIVAYAAERHINVVPEIEMPGHATAAVASYPWLGVSNKKIEVPASLGRSTHIYDVTSPKVNEFIRDVLQEVFALFPSKIIHIGGDEVAYDAWMESAHVNDYMKKNGIKTYADLQVNFTNNISKYIEQNGRQMMGWNEIMGINIHHDFEEKKDDENAQTALAKDVVVQFWKGDVKLITDAAMAGYRLVNSHSSHTYLDYPYTNISLQKAYSFDPIPADLKPEYHKQIIGTGCQMWSEWIPTRGEMHYQVFPRIAAFAETGWTNPESKNYQHFRTSLLPLLKDWEARGIYFAPLKDADPEENKTAKSE